MYYLVVAISSVLFSTGLIFLLGRPFFNLCKYATAQLDVILDSRINEEEKQTKLINNLKLLVWNLIYFLGVSILLFGISLLPTYLYVARASIAHPDVNSWIFILCVSVGAIVFVLPKKKRYDYSYWSKLLHSIILDNYNISMLLYRLEKRIFLNQTQSANRKNFVVVSGLARAGTTALTNALYDTEKFHSLTYANMPFLMAPNLWRKIYHPKGAIKRERAHGDGILFSNNSPEAFDEHFFKVITYDEHVQKRTLILQNSNQNLVDEYQAYHDLISKQDTIYLTKNNNFILRYASLRKLNNAFTIIFVFRNPIEHAISLLNQHKNFTQKQEEDSFVEKYMSWLGHYEFGKNHKMFDFGEEIDWDRFDRNDINYWLLVWLNYHTYLMNFNDDRNLFLIWNEDFIEDSSRILQLISKKIGIELASETESAYFRKEVEYSEWNIDPDLQVQTNSVFELLKQARLGRSE
jgi:hypothetical protein